MNSNLRLAIRLFLAMALLSPSRSSAVDFNRDVRPILSDRCFKCHGFDAGTRKAKLRLDVREEAMKPAKSGASPIIPGTSAKSEVVLRITSTDPDEVMPPAKDHAPLSAREIDVLKRWIDEGAEYQTHWSFTKPTTDPASSIDQIVASRLSREGLQAAPEADLATLLRRVSLALTGLPPTVEEMRAFVDERRESYEQVVDRLLASPHLGERLALDWLDVARYADTNGYYTDAERQAWPWRDWVIRAFNANMPFDQFTIEQIAGDLLPNATPDQKIATAFNRNHMVTNESGIIEEEYRTGYVCDRVETTAATWLGLTMGCAKCHDHKYDPLTMRDYYGLFAAFNNLDEKGIVKDVAPMSPAPALPLPSAQQQEHSAQLSDQIRRDEARLKTLRPSLAQDIATWSGTALGNLPPTPQHGALVHFDFDNDFTDHGPRQVKSNFTGKLAGGPGVKGRAMLLDATQYIDFTAPAPIERDRPFTLSVWINPGSSPQGCVASKQDSDADGRGFEVLWYKSQPRINLAHRYGSDGIEIVARDKFSGGQWRHLVVTYDGSSKAAGLKVYIDGKPGETDVRRDTLTGSIASREPWRIGWKGTGIGFKGGMDEFRLFDRALPAEEVSALHRREFLEGTLAVDFAKRTKEQAGKLEAYFIEHHGTPELKQLSQQLHAARVAEDAVRKSILSVSVMQEMAMPRVTHVLKRGQYDQPADEVMFAVPAALGSLPPDAPRNRLGLARWLVAKNNPLTARVIVNRLWTQCFGDGLVRTPNDFGLQGEAPTNSELLDFLAVRFRDGHTATKPWDVKALLKLIVTSATFRQSSNFTPELLARDPDNRLLARGPRFRLPAEILRDQSLAVSGLLVSQIGGPSVKPWQPPGLWEAVSYNGEASYKPDHGDATHRRGLYTFWKRQSPPPDLLTFDGPTREVCTVRRPRTNTPLQALLLLNDRNYLETAGGIAARILQQPTDRVAWAFRLVTGRQPQPTELEMLATFQSAQLAEFRRNPAAAQKFLDTSDATAPTARDAGEFAAWTLTASLLLNLDEVQTLH